MTEDENALIQIEKQIENDKEELHSVVQDAKDTFDKAKARLLKAAEEAAAKGELYQMTAEETDMLKSFRRFKRSITKPDIFRWQTVPISLEATPKSDEEFAKKEGA